MKKTVLMAAAAMAALTFGACSQGASSTQECGSAKACDNKCDGNDREELYTGILPAADAQGTLYTLRLELDDDNNYTDGDYMMVETSLAADEADASSLKVAATAYTEGDVVRQNKTVDGAEVEYICLTPDTKDSMGAASADPVYFIVNADGSLTMTGADLKVSETGLNYTLTPVK